MKTLRTKNNHNVQVDRGFVSAKIYLIVNEVRVDKNGIYPKGFYYVVVNDKQTVLSKINTKLLSWESLAQLETNLPNFPNNSLNSAFTERLEQVMFFQLQQEGDTNFQVNPNDWEVYYED